MRTLKVAICVPVYGDPKTRFMHSLTNLLIYSLSHATLTIDGEEVQLELDTFIVQCSMLTESRHRLVAAALGWEADYMLCLDADQIFPPTALMRLLAHNKLVVGANYPRRASPTAPTAAVDSGAEDKLQHLLYTTSEKAEAGVVEECAHLGFGVLLLNMKIFDALQLYAEEHEGGNFLPLFLFEPTEDKIGMIGEDVFFFRKLEKVGIRPFVDHALSWEVGHCFDVILTNAHALVQKDKWAAMKRAEKKKRDDQIDEIESRAETEVVIG